MNDPNDPEATRPKPSVPPARTSAGPPGDFPTRIGQYEVRAVLGEGKLGRVYRGYDPRLDRDVAIKVFKPVWHEDPTIRERLRRELTVVASILHANVCPIFDIGETNNTLYVIMPYVSAHTLADLIRRGAVPPSVAAVIALELASGLEAAHQRGIVHGDLKPANVFFPFSRPVLITDFGLTRALVSHTTTGLTRDGVIIGTPLYMSPEQLRDGSDQISPRSDVYSLGVILYEMLTARPLFTGPPVKVIADHLLTAPLPPSRANATVPHALDAICLRALAKKPEERFASAAELATALSSYLRTQSGQSGVRPSALRRPTRPSDPPSGTNLGAPPPPPPQPPVLLPGDPDPRSNPRIAVPRPITDQVHFSVTAPAALRAGHQSTLSVWAHLDAQRDEVLRRAQQAHPLGPVQMHTKGPVRVARGTTLSVRLRVPAFGPTDESDALEWAGDIGSATFAVAVPPGTAPGGYGGTVFVYIDGLQIARLNFDLQVAAQEAPAQPLPVRQVRHRTAFASYASRDRDAVLARIQGIQKVVPDLDIFLDVVSLRSGERWAERLEHEVVGRDVFYLFWSRSARRSKWVEREWRAALKARGVAYIDPVPLADPRAVPPPPELADELHFNDWVLAYLRGGRAGQGRTPWMWVVAAALALAALAAALFARRPA